MPFRFPRSTIVFAASFTAVILLAGCAPAASSPSSSSSSSPSSPAVSTSTPTVAPPAETADSDFAALETEFDARLGVFALEVDTGRSLAYRADDRFGFASTIKALAAAVVLQQGSNAELDESVPITAADIAGYSPVTEGRIGTGMTVRELVAAAVQYSDSTALNLLIGNLGGIDALQQALAGINDEVTSIDRLEPELNAVAPGDPRDTSTPRQLALDLQSLGFGDALPDDREAEFVELLKGNTTGDALLRAGVPEGWVVGDKTGAADYGTRNDIGILWPPSGSPIVIAVMSDRSTPDADYNDALIAEATRVVVAMLG